MLAAVRRLRITYIALPIAAVVLRATPTLAAGLHSRSRQASPSEPDAAACSPAACTSHIDPRFSWAPRRNPCRFGVLGPVSVHCPLGPSSWPRRRIKHRGRVVAKSTLVPAPACIYYLSTLLSSSPLPPHSPLGLCQPRPIYQARPSSIASASTPTVPISTTTPSPQSPPSSPGADSQVPLPCIRGSRRPCLPSTLSFAHCLPVVSSASSTAAASASASQLSLAVGGRHCRAHNLREHLQNSTAPAAAFIFVSDSWRVDVLAAS